MWKRIQPVYDYVNEKLFEIPDPARRGHLSAHMHGCAALSSLLALARGLDPDIGMAAALLHDISAILYGNYDDHGNLGADIAEGFLGGQTLFSREEMSLVTTAIRNHTEDPRELLGYDALLVEVDFLQPYLRTLEPPKSEFAVGRLPGLLQELGAGSR